MMDTVMNLLTLCFEFFKTGLFAVGGGLATLPFLSEMADKYTWFTHEQLADMIAVSESTPGPIAINCATYIGYKTQKTLVCLKIAFFGFVAALAIVAAQFFSLRQKVDIVVGHNDSFLKSAKGYSYPCEDTRFCSFSARPYRKPAVNTGGSACLFHLSLS